MTEVQKKQELHRVTVNLTPRSHKALRVAAEITGGSITDTVNRALQFYAYAEHIMSVGGEVFVREPGEEMTRVKLMLSRLRRGGPAAPASPTSWR